MNTNLIVVAVIASRSKCGLRLEFNIPGRAESFVCYLMDETQKRSWAASAKARGWVLVS